MKKFISLVLFIILITLSSCNSNNDYNFDFNEGEESENYCLVDLRGEVIYPGIYKVKEGSLIIDVINLSGGFTEYANIDNINLVNKITQNMKLIIPSKKSSQTNSTNNLININTCSISDLMTIPKIGEVKAKAIISYREENGGFNSIEELKNVSGIGESLYEAIKTYITI